MARIAQRGIEGEIVKEVALIRSNMNKGTEEGGYSLSRLQRTFLEERIKGVEEYMGRKPGFFEDRSNRNVIMHNIAAELASDDYTARNSPGMLRHTKSLITDGEGVKEARRAMNDEIRARRESLRESLRKPQMELKKAA